MGGEDGASFLLPTNRLNSQSTIMTMVISSSGFLNWLSMV